MTDHRIGLTVYNLPAIMDGDIEEIIEKLSVEENTERFQPSHISFLRSTSSESSQVDCLGLLLLIYLPIVLGKNRVVCWSKLYISPIENIFLVTPKNPFLAEIPFFSDPDHNKPKKQQSSLFFLNALS